MVQLVLKSEMSQVAPAEATAAAETRSPATSTAGEAAIGATLPAATGTPATAAIRRGNERADEMAEEGSAKEQLQTVVDRSTRKAYIKRNFDRGRGIEHAGVRRTYEGRVREKEEDGLSREERVNLPRLRSGTNLR
jgi:hypothetical protein